MTISTAESYCLYATPIRQSGLKSVDFEWLDISTMEAATKAAGYILDKTDALTGRFVYDEVRMSGSQTKVDSVITRETISASISQLERKASRPRV